MASNEKITTKEIIDRLTTGAEMMAIGLSVPGKLLLEAAERLASLSQTESEPSEQEPKKNWEGCTFNEVVPKGVFLSSTTASNQTTQPNRAPDAEHEAFEKWRTEFLPSTNRISVTPYEAWQAARLASQDADANAPWLSKAHMLCTDAGIPQGHIEQRIDALRDRLASQVPDGRKLVPIEPTKDMIQAALDCQDADPKDGPDSELYYAYKAMLEAATQPGEGNQIAPAQEK